MPPELSPTGKKIVELLAKGFSTKEIAIALRCSELLINRTIESLQRQGYLL